MLIRSYSSSLSASFYPKQIRFSFSFSFLFFFLLLLIKVPFWYKRKKEKGDKCVEIEFFYHRNRSVPRKNINICM